MNQVAPERARRAIDVAALLGAIHSAATVYWACGGTRLISTLGARILDSFSGRVWLLWPAALVKLAVALAPALLVRHRWPAPRILRYGMWAAAIVLVF